MKECLNSREREREGGRKREKEKENSIFIWNSAECLLGLKEIFALNFMQKREKKKGEREGEGEIKIKNKTKNSSGSLKYGQWSEAMKYGS